MISVTEARKTIVESTKSPGTEQLSLPHALGHVLAEDLRAAADQPPFRQSAMDGYAFSHADLLNNNGSLEVTGEIPAGTTERIELKPNEALRIFTGAPVPDNADTVVMQEHTTREGNQVVVNPVPAPGSNVRKKGEEVAKGEIALEKGTLLTAAGIGFLSMLGITEVKVYSKPKAVMVITGNELVKPGEPLAYGQVFESNSAALVAAMSATGFAVTGVIRLIDDYRETLQQLELAFTKADVVIVSGGISVGEYDFVGKALEELGTKTLFYKIRQKPGKPMFYGKRGEQSVFALPGNPASLLTCYYEYVLPALRKMSGYSDLFLQEMHLPISHAYLKKGDRAEYLRGKVENGEVTILDGQGSFMLKAFALANCLVYLPEESNGVEKGATVQIHLLP